MLGSQFDSMQMPIKRSRELFGCRHGQVCLSVNGRIGRRVACVLDSQGTSIEAYDLEGEGDYMEVEPEAVEMLAGEDT